MVRTRGFFTVGSGPDRIIHPKIRRSGGRSRMMANVHKSGIPPIPPNSPEFPHSYPSTRVPKTQTAFAKFLQIPKPERTPPRNPGDVSGYNGWTNWDTWATNLVLMNEQDTYNWLKEWKANFERKIKSGRFDRDAAKFAIFRYIVPVARGKGMAKRFKDLTPDVRIDPKMVDYDEILDAILEIGK